MISPIKLLVLLTATISIAAPVPEPQTSAVVFERGSPKAAKCGRTSSQINSCMLNLANDRLKLSTTRKVTLKALSKLPTISLST